MNVKEKVLKAAEDIEKGKMNRNIVYLRELVLFDEPKVNCRTYAFYPFFAVGENEISVCKQVLSYGDLPRGASSKRVENFVLRKILETKYGTTYQNYDFQRIDEAFLKWLIREKRFPLFFIYYGMDFVVRCLKAYLKYLKTIEEKDPTLVNDLGMILPPLALFEDLKKFERCFKDVEKCFKVVRILCQR